MVLILFGEVMPKLLAYATAPRWAALSARAMGVMGRILWPLLWLMDQALVGPMTRLLAHPPAPRDITVRELAALLDLSARRGIIANANVLLQEIVDLTQLRVSDIMVPRVNMVAYDINNPPAGLAELFRKSHLRKMPVYDGQPDRILGVIYGKTLLLNPGKPLRELVVKLPFVPESANVERLLNASIRVTRKQMAIVVDEFGGVAGIVTLQDIVEQIVGDIYDARNAQARPGVRRSQRASVRHRRRREHPRLDGGLPHGPPAGAGDRGGRFRHLAAGAVPQRGRAGSLPQPADHGPVASRQADRRTPGRTDGGRRMILAEATSPLAWAALWLALVLAVAMSALFSAMETGIYVTNKVRLELQAEGGVSGASGCGTCCGTPTTCWWRCWWAITWPTTRRPSRSRPCSCFSGSNRAEWRALAVVTPVMFILGESLPKNISQRLGERMMYPLAGALRWAVVALNAAGLALATRGFAHITLWLARAKPKRSPLGYEGFAAIVAEGQASGALTHLQSIMADRVMHIQDVRLASVMIPLARGSPPRGPSLARNCWSCCVPRILAPADGGRGRPGGGRAGHLRRLQQPRQPAPG